MIQPEEMNLSAHKHIQQLLQKEPLTEDRVNAVYRLSQHLRVFGLLSAAGYINQSNKQGGEIRKLTTPVWGGLLAQLLGQNVGIEPEKLMTMVIKLAETDPTNYMVQWRKSLELSHHWNFWARAYSKTDDL